MADGTDKRKMVVTTMLVLQACMIIVGLVGLTIACISIGRSGWTDQIGAAVVNLAGASAIFIVGLVALILLNPTFLRVYAVLGIVTLVQIGCYVCLGPNPTARLLFLIWSLVDGLVIYYCFSLANTYERILEQQDTMPQLLPQLLPQDLEANNRTRLGLKGSQASLGPQAELQKMTTTTTISKQQITPPGGESQLTQNAQTASKSPK